MCNSRGREISDPEEGPYILSRRVRVGVNGEETKNTALVREPETLWILSALGEMSDLDHDGTRRTLKISSSCCAKKVDLYCLWRKGHGLLERCGLRKRPRDVRPRDGAHYLRLPAGSQDIVS